MATDDSISAALGEHYSQLVRRFGATPRGVDWRDELTSRLRYEKMLAVLERRASRAGPYSLLDVGCGHGALAAEIRARDLPVDYYGIDVSEAMIDVAKGAHPYGHFQSGDFLADTVSEDFDYVVCNGILTQKLDTLMPDMERYAYRMIDKMFMHARIAIAFNLMSTRVNYFSSNLFYKSPAEILMHCLEHLSPHVAIDHAYGLYEYTTYVYRETP